jgi:hypothetical protein
MLEPIEETVDNLIKHLGTLAEQNAAVNVKPIYQTFTLETIGKKVFFIKQIIA